MNGNIANLLLIKHIKELERQMMDVKTDEDGGHVTFSCNVAGYRPEELKVDIEGDSLVVKGHFVFDHFFRLQYIWHLGEHKEKHGGQTIHRTFHRSVTLPDGVQKESIQCNMDDKGIFPFLSFTNA